MLVPLSWLREFVPYEGPAEELGARLTMLGLELEGIIHPFSALEQILVGEVVQCKMHPDSDHLHCCKVDLGAGELLDIVCGAPNVAEGQKVAVAPVGSILPDGTVIKKAKLRGQPSFGMICSERELGLSEDHSGIMVLPPSCDIGKTLLDALDLERDVLDLSITPNRPDCLSIIGIARETALAFNLPFQVPQPPLITDNKLSNDAVTVEIAEPELCRLYAGRILRDVKVAPSPMRMRYRLLAAGMRAISNIVDITNYILLETGQPLHAFDLQKLAGQKIRVATGPQGEKFVTLDGKERELTAQDLRICDAEKTVALAGVMGGLDSEITSGTNSVFLESAVFNPIAIRKTARRLGLNSEAAYRFERGVDQTRSIWALNRACALMASIIGAKIAPGLSLAEPKPFIAKRIDFQPGHCTALLGVAITPDFQAASLEKDGCAVEKNSEHHWTVIQPSWRPDLTREADLIEEVARIYGVNELPVSLPAIHKKLADLDYELTRYEFLSRVRHWAAGFGLHEAVNYSFTARKEIERLNPEAVNLINIVNPLSEDQNVLRDNLAPGLLWDMGNNLDHGVTDVRIFEIANAFSSAPDTETKALETPFLGILLHGSKSTAVASRDAESFDYPDMKGIVQNLLRFLHLPGMEVGLEKSHSFLNPCVIITVSGEGVGIMGRVKPELAKNWNAHKPVWLGELNLEVLYKLHGASAIKFKPLPIYPPVRRDMTVMAPVSIRVGEVLEKIYYQKLPLLEEVELIDIFVPENVAEKNLTFRLTFRHPQRTLKDQEVDKEREKIAQFLRDSLPVRI